MPLFSCPLSLLFYMVVQALHVWDGLQARDPEVPLEGEAGAAVKKVRRSYRCRFVLFDSFLYIYVYIHVSCIYKRSTRYIHQAFPLRRILSHKCTHIIVPIADIQMPSSLRVLVCTGVWCAVLPFPLVSLPYRGPEGGGQGHRPTPGLSHRGDGATRTGQLCIYNII
jgi:hypothetical protein